MNIVLWVLQVLLGVYFLFVGVNHFIVPPGLPAQMSWMYEISPGMHYFSGIAEILGGAGVDPARADQKIYMAYAAGGGGFGAGDDWGGRLSYYAWRGPEHRPKYHSRGAGGLCGLRPLEAASTGGS